MPATLSFYALEVIVAVPVDVVADGAPATTIEPDSEQCALSFKRRTTGSESTRRSQAVNIRTLSPGRSAPADLKKDANVFDLPIALGLLVATARSPSTGPASTPSSASWPLARSPVPCLTASTCTSRSPPSPSPSSPRCPRGPPSSDFRAQVLEARARQAKRFGHKGPLVNGRMTPRQLRKLCQLKPEAMSI